jgi:transcription initiation factor TFIID subunit TAF12
MTPAPVSGDQERETLSRENDLLREALALAVQGLKGAVDADRDDLWTVTAKRGLDQLHSLGFVDGRGVVYPEHTPVGWGINPRYGMDFNGVCVACGRSR